MGSSGGEKWSSQVGFLLASLGAAVGLGNIWKFPYTLGSAGGSAFVAIYLLAILLVAMPIMLGEMAMGRRGGMSPPNTMRLLASEAGVPSLWEGLGWLGLLVVFLVLSFFSVVAGWSLAYFLKAAGGTFSGVSPSQAGEIFNAFLHQPAQITAWHGLFMVFTMVIVCGGVSTGIERAMKVLMPGLFLMLLGLVAYALATGAAGEAIGYLFLPDFSELSPAVALAAVGQAFFSLNVGIGVVLIYSAYLPDQVSLPRAAVIIALGDTLIALLAGLAIFPIVFAEGLDPAAGPGLIFVTLSAAFGQMPGGVLFGSLFFLFVFVAALSSSVSMLEMMVARAKESGLLSRPLAAVIIGIAAFLFGLLTVGSFSWWEDVRLLPGVPLIGGQSIFELLDDIVTRFLMPAGGMLFALFAGWCLSRDRAQAELRMGEGFFRVWRFLVRYLAPLALGAVFVTQLL